MSSGSNTNDVTGTAITSVPNGVTTTSIPSAPANDPAVPEPKQASSVWREFQDVLKKMSRHSRLYSEIERTMDRQSDMELQLETQKKRVSSLESSRAERVKEFEGRYDEWKIEKTELELQRDTVKNKMAAAHAEEMRKLKLKRVTEGERADSLSRKLDRVTAEASLTEKKLDICNERLIEWERYISPLCDVDFEDLEGRIAQFFRDCYTLISTHFLIDLPSELLGDYDQWDKQVSGLAMPLSLPPTNSPTSKCVRMAAALHILATRLYANIFKPCYIPESPAASRVVREILDHQFKADLRKEEKLMRALILSMHSPDKVKAAINRAVRTTLDEVLRPLGPFLDSGGETFTAKLKALLHRAAGMWAEMQSSKKTVEVSMEDGDFTDWPWGSLDEFGEAVAPPGPQKFDKLNLFPRIYVPEDEKIVHHGFVLWADQACVLAADRELKESNARRRPRNGNAAGGSVMGGPQRARRQSTVIDGRSGSTQSPSTSPRSERFRFLGREGLRLQGSAIQD